MCDEDVDVVVCVIDICGVMNVCGDVCVGVVVWIIGCECV